MLSFESKSNLHTTLVVNRLISFFITIIVIMSFSGFVLPHRANYFGSTGLIVMALYHVTCLFCLYCHFQLGQIKQWKCCALRCLLIFEFFSSIGYVIFFVYICIFISRISFGKTGLFFCLLFGRFWSAEVCSTIQKLFTCPLISHQRQRNLLEERLDSLLEVIFRLSMPPHVPLKH